MFDLLADGLLLGATLVAIVYCVVLSRRLQKLSGFESGLGGAIAILSTQVDDMQKVLRATETTAIAASEQLQSLILDAEAAAGNLDILLAGLGDLPEPAPQDSPPATHVSDVVSFVTARARR